MYLVTEGLLEMLAQVDIPEGSFMMGVQLLKSVQHHDSLFPDQFLGVSQQFNGARKHSIDQIWANEFAGGSEGCAHCSERDGRSALKHKAEGSLKRRIWSFQVRL